ncbi:MAG: hypothetical protein NC122_06430 [Faecalibacterium sp.]|nr:hypothetical protein [Ruminococcus sp.]MCM1392051.1 hypothetical protein [Ruminococcus sp.]MCM1485828.1 hypothetical protein [Faecalibacterium sp.]
MNKKSIIITAIIVAISILCGVAVYASGDSNLFSNPKTPLVKDKIYYAYYNDGSAKGAIAFCLDNQFTAYGNSDTDISVCTQNADDDYVLLYSIPKTEVGVWFAGKTEKSIVSSETGCSLLGGLSGIGFTVDSTKTNVAFKLNAQQISRGNSYYIYIPDNYFADAEGVGNESGYIAIEPEIVNSYTGNLLTDLQAAASRIYDVALWGIESVVGMVR